MAMLYPVHLIPLKSSKLTSLEQLTSPGINKFAVINQDSIIEIAPTPAELGAKYHANSLDNLEGSESNIESFAYNCPIKIINTGSEIYKVRDLGRGHQLEFEHGLLISNNSKKED